MLGMAECHPCYFMEIGEGTRFSQDCIMMVTVGTWNHVCWPVLLQILSPWLSEVNGLAVMSVDYAVVLDWSVAIPEAHFCKPAGQTEADEAFWFNSFWIFYTISPSRYTLKNPRLFYSFKNIISGSSVDRVIAWHSWAPELSPWSF